MFELCRAHPRFRGELNICKMTASTFSGGRANRDNRELDTARAVVHVIGIQRESIRQAGRLLVAVSEMRLSVANVEAFDDSADDRRRMTEVWSNGVLPYVLEVPFPRT